MKTAHFLLAICAGAFISCSSHCKLPDEAGLSVGLNTLYTYSVGSNTLILQDYILDPQKVDSVSTSSKKIRVSISPNHLSALLDIPNDVETFNDIKLWVGGNSFSIPARKSDKVNYTFTFNPQGKRYKRVQITGQMNDWAPMLTPDLTLNAKGQYEVTMLLSPGTYLYQMSLDGDWNHDPNNPNKVDNGYGKYNSILQVSGENDKFPQLYTNNIERNGRKITLSTQNEIDELFVYWNNYRLCSRFYTYENNTITIKLPRELAQKDRSYIRVWARNSYGSSNDILVPLEKGQVITSNEELTRHDKHAQIIYFMLVDRFNNGIKENDHPMNRPDVNPRCDYQGGDLEGIKQKIDDGYFDTLGINTLWISPIAQNPLEPYGYSRIGKTKFAGYHGYWPISSSKVDFRFGTNTNLRDLVQDAHINNINVLLDYVANHVHEDHPLFKAHPEFATQLHLPDGRLNVELWNEYRLTTWFDTFLPTLDFGNPEVISMMTDSAMYWINEFDIDGFRHDACKHVNEDYWRSLTLKIKQADPSGSKYQIGETYGSPELISSYLNSGMLDGQFDFNVFDEASTAFAGVGAGTLTRLYNILKTSFSSYGYHNLMGYISGNHDRARFIAYASGDVKFGEDAKAAGWERNIGISDSIAYDKMALLQTFNMTIPGIPVIYYGDEIGMTGANDPDSRRMMRFDHWNKRESHLFETVSKLTHLRRQSLALIYGDFINISNEADIWVYARKYFDQEAIVLINNSPESKIISVDLPKQLNAQTYTALFGRTFTINQHHLQLTLPPYSSEILH